MKIPHSPLAPQRKYSQSFLLSLFRSFFSFSLIVSLFFAAGSSATINEQEALSENPLGTESGGSSILGTGDINGIIKALSAVVAFSTSEGGEVIAIPKISSLWTKDETNDSLSYSDGNVGIGTTTPDAKLEVDGGIKLGNDSRACTSELEGLLKYNSGNLVLCNGSYWQNVNLLPPVNPCSGLTSGSYTSADGGMRYCDGDHDGGGWTMVAKFESDNTDISGSMLTSSELRGIGLSDQDVNSPTDKKYMLRTNAQDFTEWTAKINGTFIDKSSRPTHRGNTFFEQKTFASAGSGSLSITNHNNGYINDYIVTYSNGQTIGKVLTFKTAVPGGSNVPYCMFNGGGATGWATLTGFGCRDGYESTSHVNADEKVEIYGR